MVHPDTGEILVFMTIEELIEAFEGLRRND
jgi:hypothetical protein